MVEERRKALNFCRRITSEKSWLSCALGTHLYIVYRFWRRECGWSTRTGSQCVRTEMIRVQITALKLSPKFSLSPECVRTGSQCVRITLGLFWISWVRPHSDPVRVDHPHWASKRQFSQLQISESVHQWFDLCPNCSTHLWTTSYWIHRLSNILIPY